MHRSSELIGAIAAALSKAQSELTNPEKSLTATIGRMALARPNGRSAMPRCRVVSTSCARPWASMRLPPCRPRPSTKRLDLFA